MTPAGTGPAAGECNEKGGAMVAQRSECHRCGGMMVETYADLISPSEIGEGVVLWRCVNCGDYVDRQILLNRFRV